MIYAAQRPVSLLKQRIVSPWFWSSKLECDNRTFAITISFLFTFETFKKLHFWRSYSETWSHYDRAAHNLSPHTSRDAYLYCCLTLKTKTARCILITPSFRVEDWVNRKTVASLTPAWGLFAHFISSADLDCFRESQRQKREKHSPCWSNHFAKLPVGKNVRMTVVCLTFPCGAVKDLWPVQGAS